MNTFLYCINFHLHSEFIKLVVSFKPQVEIFPVKVFPIITISLC